MHPVLVHIRFPYDGPWGQEMSQGLAALADDIASEPGLHWKLWLEDAGRGEAGGAYLFDSRDNAERYLAKHRARLAQWGIQVLAVAISALNPDLSRRCKAAATPALPARQAQAASAL
ncbi:MAG: YdhR family protein [Burkholderiales bacterium]|nr:YdhR family protein [Burkholderiales bacterium]